MKLAQVRQFALSLPDVIEAAHFHFTSFRVSGKIFATAPPGDQLLHVFVDEEDRETALALAPQAVEKLFWGKQVCGVRVSLAKAKPSLVQDLLHKAWTRKAPKRLRTAQSNPAVP